MTVRRQAIRVGAVVWAVVGALVAIPQVPEANSDARLLVGVASVLGPAAAVGAAILLGRRQVRWAGALLLVSVVTPTYYAWMLGVPALIAGLALLAAPRVVRADARAESGVSTARGPGSRGLDL